MPTRPHASRLIRSGAALVAALLVATATAEAAVKVTQLRSGRAPIAGMQDDRLTQVADPAPRVRQMADAGAAIIRVDMRWDQIAPTRPVDPTNPDDPAYNWGPYDRIVDAANANRVRVLFTVWGTPPWLVDTAIYSGDPQYGTHSFAPTDASQFGRFAVAAAKRYAPRGVRFWEGWNEPSIVIFLQPQWKLVSGRWVAVSPGIYSALQKEFYAGIKSVDPGATVGGLVTAPAGDRCTTGFCSGNRVIPMDFVRALNAPGLRPPMDVVSHHPYPVRLKPSGATAPGRNFSDLYNLDTMIKAVDSTYLKGKRVWVTEYGFATAAVKEYRIVVSLAGQAANISDAYWRLRTNSRITMGVYYALQDHPGWRSGVLTMTGSRKPGYQAHAMPLHAVRSGRSHILYGQARLASGSTRVTIQRRSGRRWVTAKRITTAPDGGFRVRVTTTARVQIRATWSGTSRSGTNTTVSSRAVSVPKG